MTSGALSSHSGKIHRERRRQKKKKKNERKKGSSKCGEVLRTGKPISKAFGVQCNIFVTYLLVLKFLRMKG